MVCKYEEIYPPDAAELVEMTDNTYKKCEMLKMEDKMCDSIKFNFTFPTILRFLEIYQIFLNLDKKNFMKCKYLIEVSLLDYKSCAFKPSIVAATSLFLNLKCLKLKMLNSMDEKYELPYDEKKLKSITGYDENNEDIVKCMEYLILALKDLDKPKNKFIAIKKKYSRKQFMEVGLRKYYFDEPINKPINSIKIDKEKDSKNSKK